MSDPNDLGAFLDEAWQHLERGVADAKSPARLPTFATVSPGGRPEVRTVALRHAARAQSVLEVHTDIETPKIAALRVLPRAGLHIWLADADVQIRISADVEVLTGAEIDDQWARVPPASRVSYGTMPVPGTPIPSVYAYEKPSERSRFAVLRCHMVEMDLVHLGTQHRRAIYTAATDWQGTWVAP
ncbi:pyridoxamine 5'-phosphate oxidase family protein [uncultured Tateyamaria sp.]|uniref:pyridoxamine 5'-phosphate oxidase family protein n=1 Tax=uncultured Tateyamaria sp. TaxID=455651 RepID=UPI00262B0063|nr:pyridoxamine 5'-phosphate oxidase family protein [uncultured Tateyamaria sp.]